MNGWDKLAEEIMKRGVVVTPVPAWNTTESGYWITLGSGPSEKSPDEKPAGEVGGIGA